MTHALFLFSLSPLEIVGGGGGGAGRRAVGGESEGLYSFQL